MTNDPNKPVAIQWASAGVRDATLTVDITGAASAEWRERVQAVIERLRTPNDRWGDIEVTKARVTVGDLAPGTEADLRLLLDGAVQQANADLAIPGEPEDEGSDDEADQAMTDAFRAFGEPG